MKKAFDIIKSIKGGDVKPVYVLDGEESYYIDMITDAFEEKLLQPHERDFNLSIFYGKDADWTQVVNECRSYPAFAAKRLVILKEAGQLKDFGKLEPYFQLPTESTVLVIAFKYKKVDGRSSVKKAITKHGVHETFDKIKEQEVADWILNYCHGKKLKISSSNADMLSAYLGNDLQKIVNEIEKVRINLQENEEITDSHIEKYIGISKEYNLFAFPKALLERDVLQSFKIADYYMANAKDHPLVVITAMLYTEFNKLYKYHYCSHKPQAEIATVLKISPYFIKDYSRAAKNYNAHQTIQALHYIAEGNLNAVGLDVANNNISILKELTAKLLSL